MSPHSIALHVSLLKAHAYLHAMCPSGYWTQCIYLLLLCSLHCEDVILSPLFLENLGKEKNDYIG